MANNLLLTCFDQVKLEEFVRDNVTLTYQSFDKWVSKRDPHQLSGLAKELENPFDISEDVTLFRLMVKSDAKVKLDSSFLTKFPAAQNIMFHKKVVNAIYSPIFDQIKDRIRLCLNSNIVLFTEMTNDDLAEWVRIHLGCEDVYYKGEVDFSKFDKSQDAFIKGFERCLYEYFGFDYELLNIWMEGEYNARVQSLEKDLSFNVENQRRSGGSNTWLGNSLVTLGILAMYYNLQDMSAVLVSGDDSLLFAKTPLNNHAEQICLDTGFETKFVHNVTPYFCSKFFVFTGLWVYFVPDPYKLLVKLGKPLSDTSLAFLAANFVSFRDLTVHFDNELVCENLSRLVQEKYMSYSPATYAAICSIHCIRANQKSFLNLYLPYVNYFTLTSFSLAIKWKEKFGYSVEKFIDGDGVEKYNMFGPVEEW